MKVFVVLALFAFVAYTSAHMGGHHTMTPGYMAGEFQGTEYVGDLQDVAGGEIVKVGEYRDCEGGMDKAVQYGIPSCKLGPGPGNPICFAKCVYRGHKGGACQGKKCVCVD